MHIKLLETSSPLAKAYFFPCLPFFLRKVGIPFFNLASNYLRNAESAFCIRRLEVFYVWKNDCTFCGSESYSYGFVAWSWCHYGSSGRIGAMQCCTDLFVLRLFFYTVRRTVGMTNRTHQIITKCNPIRTFVLPLGSLIMGRGALKRVGDSKTSRKTRRQTDALRSRAIVANRRSSRRDTKSPSRSTKSRSQSPGRIPALQITPPVPRVCI
jgi:hypothetical protein